MGLTMRKLAGGARVPHRKWTSEAAIVKMGVPARVIIPMVQHIGAPCEPIVKKGDTVLVGQILGDTGQYVSAPIHSSVSGTVANVGQMLYPGGGRVTSVEIATDGLQRPHESVRPQTYADKKDFLGLVRASGLVGLGGAGFPGHVKLNPPPGASIDCLIVNGAECEPYITSDYRFILENARSIVSGIKLLQSVLGIPKTYVGIEDNKPAAIKLMEEMTADDRNIEIVTLRSLYPQGAEKMLIYSCTGRRVPPGKLPADVGAVVMNVNSVSLIAEFMETGMPLVKKIVTVSGNAVKKPMNLEVVIGTPLRDVFAFCGGFTTTPEKILMGGPMMGIAQFSLDVPVIKNTNAALAFDVKDAKPAPETGCIRCGKCVDNCPMQLLPLFINSAAVKGDAERLKRFHVMDCIECGTCVYNCPAKRRIVQSARLGKDILRNLAAAEKKGGRANA
ncbi:MAG: electron transport complex subunit RsxC [Clostridiales bacterium]|nr:electron transport complex subunit RsxC [Clostridiales bacterium]